MADEKISALNPLVTWDDDDEIAIVDTDVVETKRMTAANVKANVQLGFLNLGETAETIDAAGAITVTSSYVVVDTFGAAATDDLDNINGAMVSPILILRSTVGARDVVVKHAVGNIRLAGGVDFTLGGSGDTIMLLYTGANWQELSRSDNA